MLSRTALVRHPSIYPGILAETCWRFVECIIRSVVLIGSAAQELVVQSRCSSLSTVVKEPILWRCASAAAAGTCTPKSLEYECGLVEVCTDRHRAYCGHSRWSQWSAVCRVWVCWWLRVIGLQVNVYNNNTVHINWSWSCWTLRLTKTGRGVWLEEELVDGSFNEFPFIERYPRFHLVLSQSLFCTIVRWMWLLGTGMATTTSSFQP